MEQYIIKGGNPLVGEVEIGGAKNAALGILAAAIMADEPVLIENLPDVNDINVMLEAIEGIGAMVQRIDRHTVKINGNTIGDFSIDYDYIKKIRASYYLLGALLGKYKRAEVALPGGCNIGSRPIDQHLKGFRALGADVEIEYGKILAEADRLVGKHIYFDVVSVGATINVMFAAIGAEGTTVIENAAMEPEIVNVASFLINMGAIDSAIDFMNSTAYWRGTFYIMNVWKDTGWGTILFLATLSGISPDLYEAAQIDGANRFKRLIYITLPALANTIITVFILNLAKVMNLFESVFVLQSPITYAKSQVLQTYVYTKTFSGGNSDYGYTTAVGLFKSFVGMILVLGCNWASKKVRGRGIE